MKKIALIGNMNNNFFALCRHLRDRGYHAELFFRHTHDHFHPKADTTSLDDLKLCHEIDWFEYSSIGERNAKIASDLKSFDFFIGSGMEDS